MQTTGTPQHSIETPTMVSSNGTAPTMAIIEELTMTHARMRSITAFETGSEVEFDVTARGVPKLHLRGRITSGVKNGARYLYTVMLADVSSQAMNLSVAIDAANRHAGESAHGFSSSAPPGLTRSSVRVPIDMPLRYHTGDSVMRSGRATNISTGGILLNSDDDLAVGTTIEMRFALPRSTRELVVSGRIVAHQRPTPNYNMAFFNIDPAARDEIARYVEASLATA